MKRKIIGITGGIGSGKSMVCKIFSILGYKIYDADSRAKVLISSHPEIIQNISTLFGENAYENGEYNRKFIAAKVFQQPELLQSLNHIVHPHTRTDFQEWIAATPAEYSKNALIKEAAILFESGAWKETDFIISVYAPENTRIQRVMQRDGVSEEEVKKRIRNQWEESKKIRMADFIIYNDEIHLLIPQILEAAKVISEN